MKDKTILATILYLIAALMFGALLQVTPCAAQTRTIPEPQVTNGKLIFARDCEACHFDLSSDKKIGPGLAGLMKLGKFKNGMPVDEYHLRRIIDRGGKNMPPFQGSLNKEQMRDLIAYLKTL